MINEDKLKILISGREQTGSEIAKWARLLAREEGIKKPKKHGATMVYEKNDLEIRLDTYVYNLSVHYKGEWVLSIHSGTCNRYIPNEWSKILHELYQPVARYVKERELKEYQDSLRERMKAWGITEEEVI